MSTVIKKISLEQKLVDRVEQALYSELEGRVPWGAWQKYTTRLVDEDFRRNEVSRESQDELDTLESVLLPRGQLTCQDLLATVIRYLNKQGNMEDQLLVQRVSELIKKVKR